MSHWIKFVAWICVLQFYSWMGSLVLERLARSESTGYVKRLRLRPSSQPPKNDHLKKKGGGGMDEIQEVVCWFNLYGPILTFGRYKCTSSTYWEGPVHFTAFIIYACAQRVSAGEVGFSFRSFLCQFQHIIWLQTPAGTPHVKHTLE